MRKRLALIIGRQFNCDGLYHAKARLTMLFANKGDTLISEPTLAVLGACFRPSWIYSCFLLDQIGANRDQQ